MPKPQRSRFKGSTPADANVNDYLRRSRDDSAPDTSWVSVSAAIRGNGTLDFEGPWNTSSEDFQFRMHEDGTVDFRGVPQGGTSGSTVFTLPEGYRPSETTRHPLPGTRGYLSASTSGPVTFHQEESTGIPDSRFMQPGVALPSTYHNNGAHARPFMFYPDGRLIVRAETIRTGGTLENFNTLYSVTAPCGMRPVYHDQRTPDDTTLELDISDYDLEAGDSYTVWVQWRLEDGGSNGHIQVQSDTVAAIDAANGRYLNRFPAERGWGYAGVGAGGMNARYFVLGSDDTIRFSAYSDSGRMFIDSVTLMPRSLSALVFSDYYFFAGQGFPTASGNPAGSDYRASSSDLNASAYPIDVLSHKLDDIAGSTQILVEERDRAHFTEVDLGWQQFRTGDNSPLMAVYMWVRPYHSTRNGFSTNFIYPSVVTWYENTIPKAAVTVPPYPNWYPLYMGNYHIGKNDYQYAAWGIANGGTDAQNWNLFAGGSVESVRVQRIEFFPVLDGFDEYTPPFS